MYLRYFLDENNRRVYTLKFQAPDGSPTFSAPQAKFSPCDPNSDERIKCKKRFDLLLTQNFELIKKAWRTRLNFLSYFSEAKNDIINIKLKEMYLSKFMMKKNLAKTIAPIQQAPMVILHKDHFKKRNSAEDDVYFSQQERNVLRKLLLKMEKEASAHVSNSAESDSDDHHFVPTSELRKKESAKAHDPTLKEIFHAHGIAEDVELMKELKTWKNSSS